MRCVARRHIRISHPMAFSFLRCVLLPVRDMLWLVGSVARSLCPLNCWNWVLSVRGKCPCCRAGLSDLCPQRISHRTENQQQSLLSRHTTGQLNSRASKTQRSDKTEYKAHNIQDQAPGEGLLPHDSSKGVQKSAYASLEALPGPRDRRGAFGYT